MSEQADRSEELSTGVAGRLWDLLVHLFGEPPDVSVEAWDGSHAGDAPGVVVHVRSRKTVRRLLWNPGELGLARAYVTGELDVEGDLGDAVTALRDYEKHVQAKGPLGPGDRRELLTTTVVLGAVGPAPRAPADRLDAVAGYAPVDEQMAGVLPIELWSVILGDRGDEVGELHVTSPDPLSVLVARWEAGERVVREVREESDGLRDRLASWSQQLDQHWDEVVEVVGDRQARVWRLSLVLDRDNLARGRVRAYRILD